MLLSCVQTLSHDALRDADAGSWNLVCTAVMNTGDQDAHDLAHGQGGSHWPDPQVGRVHRHDPVRGPTSFGGGVREPGKSLDVRRVAWRCTEATG